MGACDSSCIELRILSQFNAVPTEEMVMRGPDPSKALESADGLSRREALLTATVVGALAGVSSVRADAVPAAFGAPLVEVHVPAGVLTAGGKTPMIRGVTAATPPAVKNRNHPTKGSFLPD